MTGPTDPMEPVGHPVNRVMQDMNRRRKALATEIAAENGESAAVSEDLSADIERIKQEQS